MRSINPNVSVCWLYPVLAFGGLCLVPWWPSKGGHPYPLATAYVNDFPGWGRTLLWHVAATLVLSLVATAVHLGAIRVVRAKLSGRRNEPARST